MTIIAFHLANALRITAPGMADRLADDAAALLLNFDSLLGPAGPLLHSAGPWRAGGGAHIGPGGRADTFVRSAAGALVGSAVASYRDSSRFSAAMTVERVVAAVNACEGLSEVQLAALVEHGPTAADLAKAMSDLLRTSGAAGPIFPLLDLVATVERCAVPAFDAPGRPWHVGAPPGAARVEAPEFARFVRDVDGLTVFVTEGSYLRGREDARRIAACINACLGLPTDLLTALGRPDVPAASPASRAMHRALA
jgi:hypothetical protein